MSLLLPDFASVGLFPGRAWLRPGRNAETVTVPNASMVGQLDMLATLNGLLDEHGKLLPKGRRLALAVSDQVAPMVVLPWQDSLRQEAELHAYAQAHFDKQGMQIDDSAVMQVDYRHYGGMGIAFAIKRQWMQELLDVLKSRDLRLHRLAPISALAYWKQTIPRKGGQCLSLQMEVRRQSGLIFDQSGLIGMDVEPVTGTAVDASTRLLRRLQVRYTDIREVCQRTASAPNEEVGQDQEQTCIQGILPGAAVRTLYQAGWD